MTDRVLMGRLANFVNVALFVVESFIHHSPVAGLYALGDRRDLQAIYWLVVGGISLRAATDMLRPRSSSR